MKKRNLFIFLLKFFVIMTLFMNLSLAENISACTGAASQSNKIYSLTSNVQANVNTNCFTLGNNVTLECNNFWINGTQSTNKMGVYITGSNNTIRNCNLANWTNGYDILDSMNTYNNIYQNIILFVNEPSFRTQSSDSIFSDITLIGTSSLFPTGNNLSLNNINGMIYNAGAGITNSTISNWNLLSPKDTNVRTLNGNNIIIDNWVRMNHSKQYNLQLNNSVIKNSLMKNNYASSSGFSLYLGISPKNLTVDNLTVINSSARDYGSIGCDGCKKLIISNSIFNSSITTGNSALYLFTSTGGQTQDIKITNLIFDSICNGPPEKGRIWTC